MKLLMKNGTIYYIIYIVSYQHGNEIKCFFLAEILAFFVGGGGGGGTSFNLSIWFTLSMIFVGWGHRELRGNVPQPPAYSYAPVYNFLRRDEQF